jgi:diguanylate cyclase
LDREITRTQSSGRQPLVLAFVDVDNLKWINDNEGHVAGDQALRNVARTLKRRLRREDLIFRYGGDEFVCALLNVRIEPAQVLMREIWQEVTVRGSTGFDVGFAELRDDDDARTLIARADQCLYMGNRRRRLGEAVGGLRPFGPPTGTYELRRTQAWPGSAAPRTSGA